MENEQNTVHIGIDIRTIHQGGGCATYIEHMLPRLVAALPNATFHLFTNRGETVSFGVADARVQLHHLPTPKWALLVYDFFRVPLYARRLGIRLFHGPKSATSPLYKWLGIRTVTTIHDIIPLTHPETEKRLNRLYWSVQIPLAYKRSDAVITISRYAKQQLEERYGVRNGVTVVYHGADHARVDTGQVQKQWSSVQERYNLRKPYILYFGTLQPRKRVFELITAYWNDPALREHYDCVIAGQRGWLYEDVVRFVEQNNAQEQIRLIGAVDDATRSVLYAHASVFTYLSLDEGFGFPILEAMAAGAPVVTSNRSCLPEIAGDAALCIAAEQPEAIQKALHAVLDDATNAQQLRTRGTQRYAEFTWKQCAEETAAVYNTLL